MYKLTLKTASPQNWINKSLLFETYSTRAEAEAERETTAQLLQEAPENIEIVEA